MSVCALAIFYYMERLTQIARIVVFFRVYLCVCMHQLNSLVFEEGIQEKDFTDNVFLRVCYELKYI